MNTGPRLLAVGALGGLLFAHSTPCGGNILDSPHGIWAASGVPFRINNSVIPPGGGLTVTEVTNAATWGTLEWNKVKANLVNVAVDNTCPRGFIDNGRNCLSFEDPQRLLGGSTLAASVVGWYNSSTHSCATPDLGTLTFNDYGDSDVVFNNGIAWTVPASQGSDLQGRLRQLPAEEGPVRHRRDHGPGGRPQPRPRSQRQHRRLDVRKPQRLQLHEAERHDLRHPGGQQPPLLGGVRTRSGIQPGSGGRSGARSRAAARAGCRTGPRGRCGS